MGADNQAGQRALVEDLLRRYVRSIDDGPLDSWPDHFTDDGRYLIISREAHAAGQKVGFYFCEGKGMLSDRILTLSHTAIYEPQTYRHIISATHIGNQDGEVVEAETNYLVVRTTQDGDMTVFSAGKYKDRIVIRDGVALFQEKLVLTDSTKMDTLLALPI